MSIINGQNTIYNRRNFTWTTLFGFNTDDNLMFLRPMMVIHHFVVFKFWKSSYIFTPKETF